VRRPRHIPHAGRALAAASALALLGACARQVTIPPVPEVAIVIPPPPAGHAVLTAMNERYIGKWYMTMAFTQNVTIITSTGRQTRQVWNQYLTLPGRQRIDYLPLASKGGVLYADGMQYAFANGKVRDARPGWSPQLVLTGDVYTQMVDTTVRQLDSLGFNLAVARKAQWEGREVWVVGAEEGDSTSSQFWVDTDSLLVRRILVRDAEGERPSVTETRFLAYRNVGGVPVSHSARAYRDGRLYFRGEATNVSVGERLPVELFEPARWATSQLRR